MGFNSAFKVLIHLNKYFNFSVLILLSLKHFKLSSVDLQVKLALLVVLF